MSSATLRAVVRGKNIVLLDGAESLPDGTEVLVLPINAAPGTPAAVLAAMAAEPRVTAEDVEELKNAIAAGRRPLSRPVEFPDDATNADEG